MNIYMTLSFKGIARQIEHPLVNKHGFWIYYGDAFQLWTKKHSLNPKDMRQRICWSP